MQIKINENRVKTNGYNRIMLFGDSSGGQKTRFLDFSLSFTTFLACVTGKSYTRQEDVLRFAWAHQFLPDKHTLTRYCKIFTYIQSLFSGAKSTDFLLSKESVGICHGKSKETPRHTRML